MNQRWNTRGQSFGTIMSQITKKKKKKKKKKVWNQNTVWVGSNHGWTRKNFKFYEESN